MTSCAFLAINGNELFSGTFRNDEIASWIAFRGFRFLGVGLGVSPRLLSFASKHVPQSVVAFVAGVFVNGSRSALERQFALPRPRECGGVVHLEPVQNGVRVEKAESLHYVQITIPTEHAPCVAEEATAVSKDSRIHHHRAAF